MQSGVSSLFGLLSRCTAIEARRHLPTFCDDEAAFPWEKMTAIATRVASSALRRIDAFQRQCRNLEVFPTTWFREGKPPGFVTAVVGKAGTLAKALVSSHVAKVPSRGGAGA